MIITLTNKKIVAKQVLPDCRMSVDLFPYMDAVHNSLLQRVFSKYVAKVYDREALTKVLKSLGDIGNNMIHAGNRFSMSKPATVLKRFNDSGAFTNKKNEAVILKDEDAAQFLAGALEYVVAKMIDSASKSVHSEQSKTVKLVHLINGMQEDNALRKFMQDTVTSAPASKKSSASRK